MTINTLHSITKKPVTWLVLVVVLTLICLGCGKMGDPIPPSDVSKSENPANLILLPEKKVVLQQSISEDIENKKTDAKVEIKDKGQDDE